MEIGFCHLCLQEKELLKRAKIFPKFMYEGMIKEGGKLININIDYPEDKKRAPYGIYEAGILCENCDNKILSRYENYARDFFYDREKLKIKSETFSTIDGIEYLHLQNIDYNKLKLFSLSLLWRSSISSQPILKAVDLGSYHSEIIRKMISEGDPKTEEDYTTIIIGVDVKNCKLPLNTILFPRQLKEAGNTSYAFFINGFFYLINISNWNKMELFNKSLILQEKGVIEIPILKGKIAEDFFDDYAKMRLRLKNK